MNSAGRFFSATSPAAPAPEVDVAAAEWVVRCREGLGAAAEREFAAWRSGDSRHENAFQRLSAMAAALERARQSGATQAIAAGLRVRAGRRRVRRRVLAGAGLALLMATTGWWLRLQRDAAPTNQPPVLVTTDSIRQLPDGSTVELNRGAEIVVRFEPGFRRVDLVRGEALFSVAKNPNRPFLVRAGGIEVRAVGTAFNVRFETAGVEVLVTEGKVTLSGTARGEALLPRTSGGEPGTLAAGQRAVVMAAHPGLAEVSQVVPAEIKERLQWRSPRLQYAGVELAQAVEQINGQNRIKISLADEAMGRLRISGTLLADDPETFSRLVAETFNLEVDNRGADGIVLRKPPGAAPER